MDNNNKDEKDNEIRDEILNESTLESNKKEEQKQLTEKSYELFAALRDENNYNDIITESQVLGIFLKDPELLMQNKHNIMLDDFQDKITQSIYASMILALKTGAGKPTQFTIDSMLSKEVSLKTAYEEFGRLNGLNNLILNAETENYDYYAIQLKKWSLVRRYVKAGIDVSHYNVPAEYAHALHTYLVSNKKRSKELAKGEDDYGTWDSNIKNRFDECSIPEMNQYFRKRVEDVIEAAKHQDVEIVRAGGEETYKQIEKWQKGQSYGFGRPSQLFTTVTNGLQRGKYTVYSSGSGTGKALCNSIIIPSPSGNVRVSDVRVGDYLFDALGKPTEVLGVFPQGEREVYEITFKDGRVARCSEDHLWSYCTHGQKYDARRDRKFVTHTVKEMIEYGAQNKDGCWRMFVPLAKPCEYDKKEHHISPYVFGLILGDGSFRQHESNKSFQVSSENDYLPNIIANNMHWNLKKSSDYNYTYYFSNESGNIKVSEVLKEHPDLINKYSDEKYIPDEYKYDSIENRWELLRGLLDTDGSVDNQKARVNFSTSGEQLASDVAELCRSLGMKATCSKRERFRIDRKKRDGIEIDYNVRIVCSPEDKLNLFSLPRKKAIVDEWYKNSKRKERNDFNAIVNIKPTGTYEEMTCFLVDNPEHLFLMNDYIVTHNTRLEIASMCYPYLPKFWDEKKNCWVDNPNGTHNSALYIGTEMGIREEIEPILIAYMTNIEQNRIQTKDGLTKEELKRCKEATEFLWADKRAFDEASEEDKKTKNFGGIFMIYMPDYTIASLESTVYRYVTEFNISALFFDYIMTNTELISEYQQKAGKMSLREDQVLANVSLKLKEIAQTYNIAVETSTQITGDSSDNKSRNVSLVRGSKAIIDKCDTAVIISLPNENEMQHFWALYTSSNKNADKGSFVGRELTSAKDAPLSPQAKAYCLDENQERDPYMKPRIFTVYKNRGGMWNDVKVWLAINYSTMRVHDCFATDSRDVLALGLNKTYVTFNEKTGELDANEVKPKDDPNGYKVKATKENKEAGERVRNSNPEGGEIMEAMAKDAREADIASGVLTPEELQEFSGVDF